ncbi:MAG: nucleotidyltransferase domain-containing protein [Candidatus Binatia bacterium]
MEECYHGRSVRVFRLDRERVVARLRQRARVLMEREPDVLEVRLFGSLARGDARPGSDADLFIVLREGAEPFLERIPRLARHFGGVDIGCDVIAYTESERAALAERHNAFAHTVLDEGITLARRGTRRESALSSQPADENET